MKTISKLLLFYIILTGYNISAQKSASMVWEKKFSRPSEEKNIAIDPFVPKIKLEVSLSGNSLVSISTSKTEITAIDKNGNTLWRSSDIYKNIKPHFIYNTSNPNYMLLTCNTLINGPLQQDSVFYFDKNYQLLKGFDVHSPNTYLLGVEDGIIYSDPSNTLIKYDADGKEQWRLKNDSFTLLVTSKAPYIGMLQNTEEKHQFIYLDKNGKKIATTTQKESFNKIFPTPDGGFWLLTSYSSEQECCKFDAIGNQTCKIKSSAFVPANLFPANLVTLPDNSLLFSYFNSGDPIKLAKISPAGEINTQAIPFDPPKDLAQIINSYLSLKPVSSSTVQYFSSIPLLDQADAQTFMMGTVDFANPSASWFKTIEGGSNNNTIALTQLRSAMSFGENNTFFMVYANAGSPILKTLKVFSDHGDLKWESSFKINNSGENPQLWTRGNHSIYAAALDGYTVPRFKKIQYDNGKELIVKDLDVFNYTKDILSDSLGNDYIIHQSLSGNNQFERKITAFSNNNISWEYSFGIEDYNSQTVVSKDYPYYPYYPYNLPYYPYNITKIAESNNLLALSEKGDYYSLVKINPNCSSNLTALAYTMGNTSPCSSEKVKLVTDKKEGFTYQWQKDGINLSYEGKDAVQDVSESGTYKVIVSNSICQQTAVSNEIILKFKPLPQVLLSVDAKVTTSTSAIRLTTSGDSGLTYQWQKDGVNIPDANLSAFDAKVSGKYTVMVTKDGCSNISNALMVDILIPLGVEEEEKIAKIAPNPNNGSFKLEIPSNFKNAELTLFDGLGRERNFKVNGDTLSITDPQKGIYYLNFYLNGNIHVQKIIVMD
ncbi:Por secretion system C-terminal sorting domain-containing protein [Pseudarcicella hirudinis]|uniref:Por secretion system C-terminal sorting domain-containing protein n=1 Tax=Pseudarcicella hirudinis TaxID=1079859 RepID=A0A1I5WND9_9BACT|nr:T9SS type A sorting domain-containing protein [Pseudarcicella hirudinis]SFQ21332.1 Por secretion system C-terminal sorting domain-containing protein [Pseudarcicella hirudinis]